MFDTLKIKGGGPFLSFITPQGDVTAFIRRQESYENQWINEKLDSPEKRAAMNRFRRFYRYTACDPRRPTIDLGKLEFFDVWKATVPEPFASDRSQAERVGNIVKFNFITYRVFNIKDPFI